MGAAGVKHHRGYADARHEIIEHATRGVMVRRMWHCNPEELLSYTLSAALNAKDSAPLGAWLKYFMETEPR